MKVLAIIISVLPLVGLAQDLELCEGFETNYQDPFTGLGEYSWSGDLAKFKLIEASWPYGSSKDFADSYAMRAKGGTSTNATIITNISSWYDAGKTMHWYVYVSGNSAYITSGRGFSFILFVDSDDVSQIEAGNVNGYRLRLCDPTAGPDGLYFEKASGSGWVIIDSEYTGSANINEGWNLKIERQSDGYWQWGYQKGSLNENIALSRTTYDIDHTNGDYAGMNWYSPTTDSRDFGFDQFTVDPVYPGMWREVAVSSSWSDPDNWDDGLIPSTSSDVTIPETTIFPIISSQQITINSLTQLPNSSLTINPNSTLTTQNSTLLQSSIEGTASLIHFNNLSSPSYAVEKYLHCYQSGDTEYHYLSSPVSVPVQQCLSGYYVYPYNETQNAWFSLTSGDMLNRGEGYAVYNASNLSDTIVFNGTLLGEDLHIPITATHFSGNSLADNWNLIGNPYPSALDWDMVNKTNIEEAVYIWDACNLSYASYISGVGSNFNDLGVIPAMQAFFVHATHSGILTLPNTARVHDHSQEYLAAAPVYPTLKISVSYGDKKDESILRFLDQGCIGFDAGFDALKLFSGIDSLPQLYTITPDGYELSINSLPQDHNHYEVPLLLEMQKDDSLFFSIRPTNNLNEYMQTYFRDKLTNTEILIEGVLTYHFLHQPEYPKRFSILFYPYTSTHTTNKQKSHISYFNSFIHLHKHEPQNGTLSVYTINGQLLETGNYHNNQYRTQSLLKRGIYVISTQHSTRWKLIINN